MTLRFLSNACGRIRRGVAPLPQITDQFDHASLPADLTQIGPVIAQYPASRARVHHIQSEQGEGSMSLLDITIDSRIHPLSVVEEIAASNDLAFERSGEDEITIIAKGRFADYQLSFTWMGEIDALHLACAFDLKIPEGRRAEVDVRPPFPTVEGLYKKPTVVNNVETFAALPKLLQLGGNNLARLATAKAPARNWFRSTATSTNPASSKSTWVIRSNH